MLMGQYVTNGLEGRLSTSNYFININEFFRVPYDYFSSLDVKLQHTSGLYKTLVDVTNQFIFLQPLRFSYVTASYSALLYPNHDKKKQLKGENVLLIGDDDSPINQLLEKIAGAEKSWENRDRLSLDNFFLSNLLKGLYAQLERLTKKVSSIGKREDDGTGFPF